MFIFLLVNTYSVGDKVGNLGNYTEHALRISNSVRKRGKVGKTQKWASKSRKCIVVFGWSIILRPPISLVDVKAPFSILETQIVFL